MSRDWASKFTTDIQLLLMVSRKGTALAATRAKDSKVRDEAPPGGQAWGKRAKHADIQSQAGGGRQRRGWDNDRAEGGDRRHPNKGKRSRSPYRRRSRSPARAKARRRPRAKLMGLVRRAKVCASPGCSRVPSASSRSAGSVTCARVAPLTMRMPRKGAVRGTRPWQRKWPTSST